MIRRNNEMDKITLIGCGKDKKDSLSKVRNLYTSPYFTAKKKYAKSNVGQWGVYSAKHGFLHPDECIKPYDCQMGEDVSGEEAKKIARETLSAIQKFDLVEIVAGKKYVKPMKKVEDEFDMDIRYTFQEEVVGGMMKQMSWLSDHY